MFVRNREKVVCQKGEKHCVYMLRIFLSQSFRFEVSDCQEGRLAAALFLSLLLTAASLLSVQAGMGLQRKHCLHLFNFQAHAGLFLLFHIHVRD